MRSVGAIASGREEPRQLVAGRILAAKEDGEDANPLFGLIHVETIDDPVDRELAQARQQIVMALAA